MNEIIYMIMTLSVGVFTGSLFYGGLWFTVKRIVSSKNPALWLLGSFILRAGITLFVFYYIAIGNWQGLPPCLIGFIAARLGVSYFTKTDKINQLKLKREVNNEN